VTGILRGSHVSKKQDHAGNSSSYSSDHNYNSYYRFCLRRDDTGFISAETRSLVRDSIPDKYKWDLSHIYPDWSAWETDLARLEPLIDSFQALQGSLSGSADNLLNAFRMRDRIDRLFDSVSTYVGLKYTTDQRNNQIGARYQRARVLRKKNRISRSWFSPELLRINRVQSRIASDKQRYSAVLVGR